MLRENARDVERTRVSSSPVFIAPESLSGVSVAKGISVGVRAEPEAMGFGLERALDMVYVLGGEYAGNVCVCAPNCGLEIRSPKWVEARSVVIFGADKVGGSVHGHPVRMDIHRHLLMVVEKETLRVLGDNVLLALDDQEAKAGAIYLPDQAKRWSGKGTILDARESTGFKPGQRVLSYNHAGAYFIDGSGFDYPGHEGKGLVVIPAKHIYLVESE